MELSNQSRRLAAETTSNRDFSLPGLVNLFPPQPLNQLGYCEEEMKMVKETRKIFDAQQLRNYVTVSGFPALRAHPGSDLILI